jgi:L-ectoine synthase
MVQIIRKSDLAGSSRNVRNDVYETTRFLLASDQTGVTVTDIVLKPGMEEVYGYDDHVEIAYCIEGRATLTDVSSGKTSVIEPGVMWVARQGERFRFVADLPTRLICVFTPAFGGQETGFASEARK